MTYMSFKILDSFWENRSISLLQDIWSVENTELLLRLDSLDNLTA